MKFRIPSISMHVLYVGGEDHHLRIPFFLAMRDQGFKVTIAGSGSPAPFQHLGFEFLPLKFDRFVSPVSDLQTLRSLTEMLREHRPDIAQAYDTKPNLLLPFAAQFAVHTLAIRTITGLGWSHVSQRWLAKSLRPILRGLSRLAANGCAATIFEIPSDLSYFERHAMTGSNGIVIPAGGGGIDIAGFERELATATPVPELRSELGLEASELVITVSRLTRQKGIPTLLEAAEIIHQFRPQVRFLLVGPRESEGPLAVSQEEIDAHWPYVVALGRRSDVAGLLRISDVFAFPTGYAEGIPRVLLEATLAGLPIVAAGMPGCREVIADGQSGYIVDVGSADQLADRIIRLLDDRRTARAMVEQAAKKVRASYGLNSIVADHCRLYSQLMRQPRVVESVPETQMQ